MPRNGLPPHCSFEIDRHGKRQVRFRRRKVSRFVPGKPCSEDFMAAYARLLAEAAPPKPAPAVGADRSPPHSLGALIKAYLASPSFKNDALGTQSTRRNILESFAAAHGDKPLYYIDAKTGERVMLLKRAGMQKIVNEKAATPSAQRNFLNAARVLFRWAMREGRIVDNPTLGVERGQIKSDGYKTWDEIEIARYEAIHAVGSRARLAMALMLYTGARKSDARILGHDNIVGGDHIQFKQQKTGAPVDVPLHPKLRAIIEATPTVGIKHFVVTKSGKPYSLGGFGNAMRKWCDQAGCPEVSSHGLRKAAARRLAEAGATTHQIAAITGHASLREVERYTEAAERKRLAGQGMAKLIEGGW
jgi:integrase